MLYHFCPTPVRYVISAKDEPSSRSNARKFSPHTAEASKLCGEDLGREFYRISHCTCESLAENSWHSPPPCAWPALTPAPSIPPLSLHIRSFLIPFSLILTFTQFGSSTSFLETVFSQSTLRTMARSMIYGTQSPAGFRSHLYHRSCVASSVHFLSRRTLASNHGRILNSIPHCRPPSTLDSSRVPRRDVGDTGEISKGWLASTESQTQDDQSRYVGQDPLG